MIFRQLLDYDTNTFTYLIADEHSNQALIIDPVIEQFERDLEIVKELDLNLKYIIETHIHADHITGAWKLKEATGAKTVLGKATGVDFADVLVDDGDKLSLGELEFTVLSTPGHTHGCTSFYTDGFVFTGDALLIRGCGRSDFQQGDSHVLFSSVRDKLFLLPDETLVFPGHEYRGRSNSLIGEEKVYNPRLNLNISENEFVKIMTGLNLAPPKKLNISVPANLKGGRI